jgi:hypothetical protein
VDCRKLNNFTKKDFFPVPRIDDILDTVAAAKCFSTLDLKSGYWQMILHPVTKRKERSVPVMGCGNSPSCLLVLATVRQLSSS